MNQEPCDFHSPHPRAGNRNGFTVLSHTVLQTATWAAVGTLLVLGFVFPGGSSSRSAELMSALPFDHQTWLLSVVTAGDTARGICVTGQNCRGRMKMWYSVLCGSTKVLWEGGWDAGWRDFCSWAVPCRAHQNEGGGCRQRAAAFGVI